MNISFKNIPSLLFYVLLFIIYFHIVYQLGHDIYSGGSSWRQGDWLINNEYEYIRRGFFGSFLIYISDILSINLLLFLGFIQWFLFTVVFFIILLSIHKLGISLTLACIILSPGFFIVFWFNDFGGAFRKEILFYFSVCIILFAQALSIKSKIILLCSSAFFILSVLSHEANIFFLPFFLLSILTYSSGFFYKKITYFFVYLTIIGSSISFLYAIIFYITDDSSLICKVLVERGLSDKLCYGSILYLTRDIEYAIALSTRQ